MLLINTPYTSVCDIHGVFCDWNQSHSTLCLFLSSCLFSPDIPTVPSGIDLSGGSTSPFNEAAPLWHLSFYTKKSPTSMHQQLCKGQTYSVVFMLNLSRCKPIEAEPFVMIPLPAGSITDSWTRSLAANYSFPFFF